AIAQPRPSATLVPRPVPPPQPPSAERIYREAEAAMHRRDTAGAQRALEDVVALGGGSPLADVARYELAQLAVRAGNQASAAQWLDALLASDREPALREPARFLRCEVQVRSGDAVDARRCLESFRARFPDSSRDATALGWLVRLAPSPPQCPPLRSLVDEYLRRYPTGPDAALAARRRAACGP
ncbi:MAG TPA: tetratricopeptide repeat protein, partial [Polyangia bacterium]|nr:tetratricopeptide repeat protein [Polyangia bacterium]